MLFGAFKTKTISLIRVWVMFILTMAAVMFTLNGIPETAIVLEFPAGSLSATGIFSVGEQNDIVLEEGITVNFIGAPPTHIIAGLGVTSGACGHCAMVNVCIDNADTSNNVVVKNCFLKLLLALCRRGKNLIIQLGFS